MRTSPPSSVTAKLYQTYSSSVEVYFSKHEDNIRLEIDKQRERVKRCFRDDLTYENVMAEVFLRASKCSHLSDEDIGKIILSVIKQSVQDESSRKFQRRHLGHSTFAGEDSNGTFILESHSVDPEEIVLDPRTIKIGRARLLQVKTGLAPSQVALLDVLSTGLPIEEVAGKLGRNVKGVEKSLKLIESRAVECLNDFPPHKSISADSWSQLNGARKMVAGLYLLGVDNELIKKEMLISEEVFTMYLNNVKSVCGLNSDVVAVIRRENMIRLGNVEAQDNDRFVNFLYPAGIPNDWSGEESKLVEYAYALLDYVTERQKNTIRLLLEGNKKSEISLMMETDIGSVCKALRTGRESIVARISQLKKLVVPEGIDLIKWHAVEPQARKVIASFVNGSEKDEIANALKLSPERVNSLFNIGCHQLEMTRNDLIDLQIANILRKRKKEVALNKQAIAQEIFPGVTSVNPDELVKVVCNSFKTFDPRINLRVFKLKILGLRNFHVARLLGVSQASVATSLKKITERLKERVLEQLETPCGLDPYRWIMLPPRRKEFVTLALRGYSPNLIPSQTSYKVSVKEVRSQLNIALKELNLPEGEFVKLCVCGIEAKVA